MGLDMELLETTPLGYSQTNGTVELREILAGHYPGASIDHIQVTNGTSEANFLSCLTLLFEGDEVLFELPNYMQVYGIPPSSGATVKTFPLRVDRNWEPDWDAFGQALSDRTRLIYVSNPNNPTGSILSREAMMRLVRAAEEHEAFLLADEVYQGAELDGTLTPSFWGMSDRVIVTSGLSKAFGLPGLRIGWLVGPPELIANTWAQHDYITIGPGTISDLAARVAVRDANRKRLFDRGTEAARCNLALFARWVAGLDGLLEYVEPKAGAFAFVKYRSSVPSAELAERIRRNQDVLVVPGAYLGMEGYLRLSIGVPSETLEAGLAGVAAELRASL
jgi:aspartate/methionine/tyrosine aminotransferase